jgi:hypothetical protein
MEFPLGLILRGTLFPITVKSIQEWAKKPNPELAAQLKELLLRMESTEKKPASPI